jgi:hypothetical protein
VSKQLTEALELLKAQPAAGSKKKTLKEEAAPVEQPEVAAVVPDAETPADETPADAEKGDDAEADKAE